MNQAAQLKNWARAGYFARGLIYILMGYVALSVASADETSEMMKAIEGLPLGNVLLAIIAVGAFGYGIWKFYDAAANLDDHGDGASGAIKRLAIAVGGFAYWLLAFLAGKTLLGANDGSGGGDESAKEMAADQASGIFGDWIIGVIGVAVIVTGINQLRRGLGRKFLESLAGHVPDWMKWTGTIGYTARGIIFLITGWYLIKRWMDEGGGVASTIGVLDDMRGNDLVFTGLAVGLILFGIFSLMEARYRIIPNRDLRPGH